MGGGDSRRVRLGRPVLRGDRARRTRFSGDGHAPRLRPALPFALARRRAPRRNRHAGADALSHRDTRLRRTGGVRRSPDARLARRRQARPRARPRLVRGERVPRALPARRARDAVGRRLRPRLRRPVARARPAAGLARTRRHRARGAGAADGASGRAGRRGVGCVRARVAAEASLRGRRVPRAARRHLRRPAPRLRRLQPAAARPPGGPDRARLPHGRAAVRRARGTRRARGGCAGGVGARLLAADGCSAAVGSRAAGRGRRRPAAPARAPRERQQRAAARRFGSACARSRGRRVASRSAAGNRGDDRLYRRDRRWRPPPPLHRRPLGVECGVGHCRVRLRGPRRRRPGAASS